MKKLKKIILSLILIFLSGCVYDYPVIREKCSILIQREYILPFHKELLFTKINYSHGFSDTLNKNLNDSLFYFSIIFPILNKRYLEISLDLLCSVNETVKGNTKIRIDRIIEFNGRIPKKTLESNVKIVKSLNNNELIQFIEQNFIFPLRSLDTKSLDDSRTMIHYDNKELLDNYIKSFDK